MRDRLALIALGLWRQDHHHGSRRCLDPVEGDEATQSQPHIQPNWKLRMIYPPVLLLVLPLCPPLLRIFLQLPQVFLILF